MLMSADIGFCPPVAMKDCPLTAIQPLSVIGSRAFANAAYRHLGDTVRSTSRRHWRRLGLLPRSNLCFGVPGPGPLPGALSSDAVRRNLDPLADITPKIATSCSCSLTGNVSR